MRKLVYNFIWIFIVALILSLISGALLTKNSGAKSENNTYLPVIQNNTIHTNVVTGNLWFNGYPATGYSMALGTVVYFWGVPTHVVYKTGDPRTVVDENGLFIFDNIPDKDYGVILDVGYTMYLLNHEDGSPALVKVKGSEIYAGFFRYDNVPFPPLKTEGVSCGNGEFCFKIEEK